MPRRETNSSRFHRQDELQRHRENRIQLSHDRRARWRVQVLDYKLPPDEEERLLASARFVGENIARAGY